MVFSRVNFTFTCKGLLLSAKTQSLVAFAVHQMCGKYSVIHKSLRDFRTLRYSSREGHAEGEHVNRGTDTPSSCPTLQVLEMSTLGGCLGCHGAEFGSSGEIHE